MAPKRRKLYQFASSDKTLQSKENKKKQRKKRKLELEEEKVQIQIQCAELKAIIQPNAGDRLPIVQSEFFSCEMYTLPLRRNVYTFVKSTPIVNRKKQDKNSTTFVAQLTHVSTDITQSRKNDYSSYKAVFRQINPHGFWAPNKGNRDFHIFDKQYLSHCRYGLDDGTTDNNHRYYLIENFQCEQSRWITALANDIINFLVEQIGLPKVLASFVVEQFYVPL
jgi:hypothetical protein